jgi:hypothetical protein
MDADAVRGYLVKILEDVQSDSGCAPVSITGSTYPLTDLGSFDSKTWPAAVTELSQATGISIPAQKNIFIGDRRQRLTVDEIVDVVCSFEGASVRASAVA